MKATPKAASEKSFGAEDETVRHEVQTHEKRDREGYLKLPQTEEELEGWELTAEWPEDTITWP